MIAEAQLAINEMQIDDIQNAKYEIAKNIKCNSWDDGGK